MTWLLDTLVWTGALIALVIVARRPVARQFGARAAYALWVLPLLRLVLPPVVLPAWLAPATEPVTAAPGDHAAAVAMIEASAAAPMPVSPAIDWSALAVAVWLGGAAVYLVVRLVAYRRLRQELLAGARAVGHEGRVRLIETAAAPSPLALGVFDKVIALPPGFMAQHDRAARDLALAHELAHHRAHDLVANFAALPLFALHWFSPLSWFGWHAMRRDQEAACDARVVERRDRAERALYAAVIVSATAAPKPGLSAALAAPMACPVLGDESIIHRLRTLTMDDPSDRRRRAGLLLVGAAAIALPLTASISYAQDQAPEAPQPPAAPSALADPAAPLPPEAPAAPGAPDAPAAPKPGTRHVFVTEIAPDGARTERRMVLREIDTATARSVPPVVRGVIVDGNHTRIVAPDSPEFRSHIAQLEKRLGKLADLDGMIARSVVIDEKQIAAITERAVEAGLDAERIARLTPRILEDCEPGASRRESRSPDGTRIVRICTADFGRRSVSRLQAARDSIARNDQMSAEVRAKVVQSLDEEIARLEADK